MLADNFEMDKLWELEMDNFSSIAATLTLTLLLSLTIRHQTCGKRFARVVSTPVFVVCSVFSACWSRPISDHCLIASSIVCTSVRGRLCVITENRPGGGNMLPCSFSHRKCVCVFDCTIVLLFLPFRLRCRRTFLSHWSQFCFCFSLFCSCFYLSTSVLFQLLNPFRPLFSLIYWPRFLLVVRWAGWWIHLECQQCSVLAGWLSECMHASLRLQRERQC